MQAYSEICIFLFAAKKVLQKQSTKIDFKEPGKSCDEIDDDVNIVNLGQKYKGNLGY